MNTVIDTIHGTMTAGYVVNSPITHDFYTQVEPIIKKLTEKLHNQVITYPEKNYTSPY